MADNMQGSSAPPPELTTLFCRALYDYTSPDSNSLSFRQGKIIEVLTQLGSGWWDGIVRGERGWFPSNFTEPISEHEALEALDELSRQNASPGMQHGFAPAADARDTLDALARESMQSDDHADFWMPQVTTDGKIYYLNTRTGQRAQDLPAEPETDDSSGYYPTDSDGSRNSSRDGSAAAFGVPGARSGTPEPWQKRLADDGRSYYYVNRVDGTVSRERPTQVNTPATSVSDAGETKRDSTYSDSSAVDPELSIIETTEMDALLEDVLANSLARQQLDNAPGPNLTECESAVRAALLEVARVVDVAEDFSLEARLTDTNGCLPQTVLYLRLVEVVHRTRELLHVSGAAFAGGALADVWKRILHADPRPSPKHLPLPQELKATQRKVAATLSKLVLSARAAGHHPSNGTNIAEVRQRLGKDASDLESAIRTFMNEWKAACIPPFHVVPEQSPAETRRLRAAVDHSSHFVTSVGGGSAASWTGWGFGPTRGTARQPLSNDVVSGILEVVQRVENLADDLRDARQDTSARPFLTSVSDLIALTTDIDIAPHIDVQTLPPTPDAVDPAEWEAYRLTIRTANTLMVRLEAATQDLYDRGARILTCSQSQDGDHAEVLENLDAVILDAHEVHDALYALCSVKQAQASSVVATYRVRDDASTLAGTADNDSVRTGESSTTVVPVPPMKEHGRSRITPSNADEDSEEDEPILRTGNINKIHKRLGELPAGLVRPTDDQPAFMGPSYKDNEILLIPEGVRGASLAALIERLTLHEHRDALFIDTFMLTFKSFSTPDQVLDLLIQRFFLQPPDGLTDAQFNLWADKKQKVVQLRVINILTIMVKDAILEKEDMHVLARFKEFAKIAQEELGAAAQPLVNVVERARSGSDAKAPFVFGPSELPPPPQMPKNLKKFKLQDLDPIELARQLTIIESRLFSKLRLLDCLQRAKEQQSTSNVKDVISTQNGISDWVSESILHPEDPKRRAAILRHFIQIAEQCRVMQNYSSMTAIVAGINAPSIRRLKRTWEILTVRQTNLFESLETTLAEAENFNRYKLFMAKVQPPAIPFLGVYLTTLTFIQDGAKDFIPGKDPSAPLLINFQKRHKAAEVLREIKRFQHAPYNLTPVPQVIALIEESIKLTQFDRDKAWALSMEREPREREEEKVQRLLQDSGFV